MDKPTLEQFKKTLDDLIAVQCADGNYNYDPYMHGLANGLILARSVIDNSSPAFLKAPKVWLSDSKPQNCTDPKVKKLEQKLFDKKYDGESIADISRDIYEAMDEKFNPAIKVVPLDNNGIPTGTFAVTIKWNAVSD